MEREHLHSYTHGILISAIAFTMPFSMVLNNACIVLAFLNVLAVKELRSSIPAALKHPVNVMFFLFFCVHLAGILYSRNVPEALHIAERRLPLLVFPLLLFNQGIHHRITFTLRLFCVGMLLAALLCIGVASYHYMLTQDTSLFFYHRLSAPLGMNAVYLSAYAVVCVIILTLGKITTGYIRYISIGTMLVFILLLSSKIMLAVLCAYLVFYTFKRTKGKRTLMACSMLAIAFFGALYTLPDVRKRFSIELRSDPGLVRTESYRYDTPFTGTSLRLVIWKHCFTILNENNSWLAGTGTGDFQDKLNEKYVASGMYVGNGREGYIGYGPHNQYIEVLLYGGICGLIIFMVLLFFQLRTAIASKDLLFICFLIVCVIFFCSESVISTNKGIVFYSFFSVLLHSGTYFKSH
jgi:O-antigen ligase